NVGKLRRNRQIECNLERRSSEVRTPSQQRQRTVGNMSLNGAAETGLHRLTNNTCFGDLMRNSVSALLIAAALGVSGAAQAATTTTSFQVTATVLKTCSATSSALAFGNYTPGAGAVTGSTTV